MRKGLPAVWAMQHHFSPIALVGLLATTQALAQQGTPSRIGIGVSPPQLIRKAEPEYSQEARDAHVQGTVMLSVVVETDGVARDIKVIRPLGYGLDEKAIEAVSKWRFRPGQKDGEPVRVMAQIEVNFRLLDGPAPGQSPAPEPALSDAAAYVVRGGGHLRRNEYELAAADFTEALGLKPGYSEAYMGRGTAYMHMGQSPRAVADLLEAIHSQHPEAHVVYSTLGLTHTRMNQPDKAIEDYTEALRLKPDYAAAYLQRGLLYSRSGDEKRALADLDEAIRYNPALAPAYANRAGLRRRMGDTQGADADLKKFQELRPATAPAAPAAGRAGVIAGIIGEIPSQTRPAAPAGIPVFGPQGQQRIRVDGNVEEASLIRKVMPAYPPLAKQARVQGTVRFEAIVGKDGTILNLQLISGHPLLIPPAQAAVKQWVYKPVLLNGEPVEVVTQIDVNFTLGDGAETPAAPIAGRWRSLETSKGGIGGMFDFHPDGTVDFSPGAVVESDYRIEGGELILPSATVNGPEQRQKMEWAGDDRLSLTAGDVTMQLERQGSRVDPVRPLPGEWTPAKQVGPSKPDARWIFKANGKCLFLSRFTTQHGRYSVDGDKIHLELPGRAPIDANFDLQGNVLILPGPNGTGQSRFERY